MKFAFNIRTIDTKHCYTWLHCKAALFQFSTSRMDIEKLSNVPLLCPNFSRAPV